MHACMPVCAPGLAPCRRVRGLVACVHISELAALHGARETMRAWQDALASGVPVAYGASYDDDDDDEDEDEDDLDEDEDVWG